MKDIIFLLLTGLIASSLAGISGKETIWTKHCTTSAI